MCLVAAMRLPLLLLVQLTFVFPIAQQPHEERGMTFWSIDN